MLQARFRGSKTWYRPDRDYITVHPRIISRAIADVTAGLTEEEDIKRLGWLATELAKLVNMCGNRVISKEDLEARLTELDEKYPYLTMKIAEKMFHASFDLYRSWQLEMLPENPDGSIDLTKVSMPVEVQPTPAIEGPK